ncbi:MAG: bifunctional diguanylate cyclase/phosphodiesterase [Oscillospiraceae bacterium]
MVSKSINGEPQGESTASEPRSTKSSIQYVFEALYHSGNSTEAVHSALALVASHFSFERGYIFETDKGGKTTSNTFEWCAEGITSEIANLQNVPIEAASTANSSFLKTGLFVLKSLDDLQPGERCFLEPQGIQSMVQFGIFDKGQLLGFIGFDNCRSGALRNEAEIDEIATISNILATFFVKQRADEAFYKDTQVQLEVMNHLNNYVYVVNPENFEVLFMNNQARKIMNYQECTEPCHKYFRGNNSQCPDCPLRKLRSEKKHHITREIFNERLGIWLETTASELHWAEGVPACLIECADITAQKKDHLQHIKQLETLAFVDELTGSRSFYKFKVDAQEIIKRHKNSKHFLVKLDIEKFKLINQIYGYKKGDDILRCVARAIKQTTRNQDEIFARVFNDEFVALFSMEDSSEISQLCDVFLDNFYSLLDKHFTFNFTFAYGVCVVETEDVKKLDIKNLFEKVNVAHKEAKLDKTNKFVVYDEAMIKKALHAKEIENKMSQSLKSNEFLVYLQPKYRLDSEMLCGAEALTRWQNENRDLFLPKAFIPIFERNGFITKLDFHALKSVCLIIKDWISQGIEPLVVSVNFSRLHISNRNFVKELCAVVDGVGIDHKWIEIEITETAIYDNIDRFLVLLEELHKNGFTISMDDFGSGYSSLGMLKDLSVDIIKLDRSFFSNQKDARRSKIVVGCIIKMAEELGIKIVAEGVEDRQQIDLLRELNCDMVQGYYYAKPMEAEKFTALIKQPKKFKRPS